MTNPNNQLQEQQKEKSYLQLVNNRLNTLLQSKSEALPKNFNQTRFLQNCMTVLQDTYGIEKVEPTTVARTMLKGAFLGLDFFNRECYAIPYGNKLQFQTDYKGEIKLAKKYSISPIQDIYAKLVREGDEFEECIKEGRQIINFKPKPFNNASILGAFAVALFKDGSMVYDTMSVEEMESVKENFSQKSNKTGEFSKAWKITPGEMYKKTVLRRLCKLIELDFDTIEQKKAFDEGSGMDFKDKEVEEKMQQPKSSLLEEFEQTQIIDVEEGEMYES